MPVKVKLKLRSRESGIETRALAFVNTGFITDEPEIAIPILMAVKMKIGRNGLSYFSYQ